MLKKTVCTVLLCGVVCILSADTIPGGDVSGTWYAANSPYYITGHIEVPLNDTLLIEPGVSVIFLGTYYLRATGYREAIGTASDSIHFFPEDTAAAAGWIGIILQDVTGLQYPFSYCTFRYAFSGLYAGFLASPVISHCNFSHNSYGIYTALINSSPQISNSIFRNSIGVGYGGAIRLTRFAGSAPVQITDCIFEYNTVTDEGGAIYCTSLSQGIIINDCVFAANTSSGNAAFEGGGAICAESTDVDISHCTFFQNHANYDGGAIMAQYCSLTVDHCTFSGNSCGTSGIGDGLFLEYSDAIISNSIFAHNPGSAVLVHQSNLSEMMYSDFYDNNQHIQLVTGSIPADFGVLDTVNYNGDSCDVYFNIFMDPMFEDTANGNYHLTKGSPCIDAGDPAFPHDPDGTITDMGTFWYDQSGIEEYPVTRDVRKHDFLGATIFSGPLQLPESKNCIVYDITGRVVIPDKIKPGVYFIQVDGEIIQKVIKAE